MELCKMYSDKQIFEAISKAQSQSTYSDKPMWWHVQSDIEAVEEGVARGWANRPSHTQAYWTEEGLEALENSGIDLDRDY